MSPILVAHRSVTSHIVLLLGRPFYWKSKRSSIILLQTAQQHKTPAYIAPVLGSASLPSIVYEITLIEVIEFLSERINGWYLHETEVLSRDILTYSWQQSPLRSLARCIFFGNRKKNKCGGCNRCEIKICTQMPADGLITMHTRSPLNMLRWSLNRIQHF